MATQRFLVSGQVQGVGFRDWVVRRGKNLGLVGWVRNLRDGRLELFADGEEEALAQLAEALRDGPSMARVDNVEVLTAEPDKRNKGFTKRFTA